MTGPDDTKEIAALRQEIEGVDRAMIELLERRFRLAAEVGRAKARAGTAVVVRDVEQRVLSRARDAAELCGVSAEVMEAIFSAVIRGAVERQHRVGVERGPRGGKRLLVLGAAGGMGTWLRRFLESIGHQAAGVDPAWAGLPATEGRWAAFEAVPDPAAFDALIVSVPLQKTPEVLASLAGKGLRVPVIEVASIKSHVGAALDALRREGTPALALHPMFGPGKNPYEPITVVHAVLADEGKERGTLLDLLAHPYLDLVSVPFARHDKLMGWLLGLAHLSAMIFADALAHSGLDPDELRRIASTTFSRQVSTARSVLDEDPGLYFAIQSLNPFRGEVYGALTTALGELTGLVRRGDAEGFSAALRAAEVALP